MRRELAVRGAQHGDDRVLERRGRGRGVEQRHGDPLRLEAHRGVDDRLLTGEVAVQGRPGRTRLAGDVVERGLAEALKGDARQEGLGGPCLQVRGPEGGLTLRENRAHPG